MPTDIKLPNMGDGVDSGDVLDVLVKEGDTVAKDQGLIELETGKATVQVPSDVAGKVLKVHVAKGQTIPIGATLVTVEAASGSGGAAPAKAPPAAQKAPAPAPPAPTKPAAEAPKPTPAPKPAATVAPPKPAPAPVVAKPVQAVAAATEVAEEVSEQEHEDNIPAGPAVRRFAREVGIDLRRVTGTGIGGRISREDVLAAVRQASQGSQTVPSTPAAGGAAGSSDSATKDNWGHIRTEKLSRIRKTIAQKMHESTSTIPSVTNFDDADVTDLERIRIASKDDYAHKGIKLTSMPFVIKAVAMALRAHPTINASIDMDQDQIIYKEYVNVGIAVDTERGLVVPSLRNADNMSIADIARALGALSESVRTSSFTIADLQGSTFTISNLGAIGGTYSTPIINPPEVAILLIGRSRKVPVVIDDKVEIRLMMPLSLSYDHRLVDGATAARFLNDVIGFLKTPSRLLLAP